MTGSTKPVANVEDLGAVTVLNEDGTRTDYRLALLITFDSPEDMRKALRQRECALTAFRQERVQ